jgi:hypothetical protein
MFRLMGKGTVGAHLDGAPVLFAELWFSGAMLPVIQRTVAEQAVKILKSLMAGKIFTIPVFKKTI